VEPGPGRDIENFLLATRFQNIDKKLAFAFRPGFPIDQFIPLIDKALDIFVRVMSCLENRERILAEILGRYRVAHKTPLNNTQRAAK